MDLYVQNSVLFPFPLFLSLADHKEEKNDSALLLAQNRYQPKSGQILLQGAVPNSAESKLLLAIHWLPLTHHFPGQIPPGGVRGQKRVVSLKEPI